MDTTMTALDPTTAYQVADYPGIAWRYDGPETEIREDDRWYDTGETDDDGEPVWYFDEEPEPTETGRVIMVMIGDDRRFTFDPEDCSPLADDEYCPECGQIGCAHGRI
jgi:hypothetical protein